MSNIFGTSVAGLLAFQRALATTSHNISNVNTEGFSRQRVHLVTQVPHAQGGHFVGTGVVVSDVQRIFDSVRMSAVRTNTSEFQRLDAYHELSSRIDNLLADKDAGLSPAMQGLFEAVNEVANDPTSQTSRQVLLSEGQNLVSRLHFLDGRFDELERDVNARMTAQVSELNELAQGIAKLNKEIAHSTGRTGGTPNDLLDQRDHMITRMSGLVAVQTVVQNDGSINVSIGNGQPLVVGYKANSLEVTRNQYDKSRMDISFSLGSSSINVTHGIHGGSLGGMLTYRDDGLDPARRELGVLRSDERRVGQ